MTYHIQSGGVTFSARPALTDCSEVRSSGPRFSTGESQHARKPGYGDVVLKGVAPAAAYRARGATQADADAGALFEHTTGGSN